jgi:hypothetical protein
MPSVSQDEPRTSRIMANHAAYPILGISLNLRCARLSSSGFDPVKEPGPCELDMT